MLIKSQIRCFVFHFYKAQGMEEVHDSYHGQQDTGTRRLSKRWCLTVFDDVWTPTFTPDMKFAVWQRERCPQSQRIHVHIYVRFVSRKRMAAVKNAFARQDMHCEVSRGTEEECTNYCEKEESRIEAGARWGTYDANEGKQGRRSDLEAIYTKAKAGTPVGQIADEHPGDYIRYHSGIDALIAQVAPKPPLARDVVVIIFWGPTGTGKTHRIMHQYPDCYCVRPGRDPWGHYKGEECVFFDEFDWTKWTCQEMNQYLDKWRVLLDARYRNRYAEWTRVAICANSSPVTWWPSVDLLLVQAFRRRIATACFHVVNRDTPLEELVNTPTF